MQMQLVSHCLSVTLNPKSESDFQQAVQKHFLEELSTEPPEFVIIFCAGHGKANDHNLFLMSTLAKFEDETCISYLEMPRWLNMYSDDFAQHDFERKKFEREYESIDLADQIPTVRCLLILDISAATLAAMWLFEKG